MRQIINNTDLFEAMKSGDAWEVFQDWNTDQESPICMLGGLDHITIGAKQIKLHDIGMNGRVMDIIIRRQEAERLPESPTYTTSEVASMFHVTSKTIYNWVETGKLHPFRTSKRSGSKLLFPKDEVDVMFQPVRFDIRDDYSAKLWSALESTSVKLSNGETDVIFGLDIAPDSSVNVLTESHGWFTLSGRSLSTGTMKHVSIVNYYADPKFAHI